jgi:sugar diacid utilization regulator
MEFRRVLFRSRSVLALARGAEAVPLRVAETVVGELRMRARGERSPAGIERVVGALIALEVERSQAPERASGAAVAAFVADLLDRRVTDRENILARAAELGADLAAGGAVLVARARPRSPQEGDWRARVLELVERGARAIAGTSLAASVELMPPWRQADGGGNHLGEIVVVAPVSDAPTTRRLAESVQRELEDGVPDFALAVATSRVAADPVDLHRAGAEALLAANVAEAESRPLLAFEETGSYRLLLPAMSEDPAELRRFHDETVAPLVAYDEQYETELVRTLETYLDCDGNVARTAERLFTHRHTIRYRLERVKELTGGLDVGSTDGRERLGLGLKAMRVLGIHLHAGPATERGAEAGRVPRDPER